MKNVITLVLPFCGVVTSEITIEPDGSIINTESYPNAPLERARELRVPVVSGVHNAEYEHATFWDDNGYLLREAWREWEEQSMSRNVFYEDYDIFDPVLSDAIGKVFANPSANSEAVLTSLWSGDNQNTDDETQVLPEGVYATQLLSHSGIKLLRSLLDQASESGIPTRRPNGMNRNGFILDSKVNGAVPIQPLIDFIEKDIIQRVVRPVGRMLFQEYVGCNDDVEYFAFTIRYDGKNTDDKDIQRDMKLNEHRDASVITMNINLNLPNERYAGSDVYFREFPYVDLQTVSSTNTTSFVRFAPGMAIIHLGAHRHGTMLISPNHDTDERPTVRYNLVIWLFGKDGNVRIAPYFKEEQMNVVERWFGCTNIRSMMSNVHNFA